jgi:DNA-binding MarR family transcriptional regulator
MPPVAARAGDAGDDPVVEPRFSYVVARLERAVRVAIGERVGPYGLTTSQYTTLSIVGGRGGLSNAQLARRAYITPQSMSEVIEALETKGLIARGRHPTHGRALPAELTREGRRVLTACNRSVDELEDEMLRGLSAKERADVVERLKSAVRALHAGLPADNIRQPENER